MVMVGWKCTEAFACQGLVEEVCSRKKHVPDNCRQQGFTASVAVWGFDKGVFPCVVLSHFFSVQTPASLQDSIGDYRDFSGSPQCQLEYHLSVWEAKVSELVSSWRSQWLLGQSECVCIQSSTHGYMCVCVQMIFIWIMLGNSQCKFSLATLGLLFYEDRS